MGTSMGGNGFIGSIFGSIGFYSKSFFFFLGLAVLGLAFLANRPLQADEVINQDQDRPLAASYDLEIRMQEDGTFYSAQSKLDTEIVTGEETYRYRYQVVNHPDDPIEELSIAVRLPKPIPEQSIAHRFISNGGTFLAESRLLDNQTLVFQAQGIGIQAQLTLEIEVPKNYISSSAFSALQQRISALPPMVWTSLSVALPVLTGLLLLLVALARSRKIPIDHLDEVTDPPSRLSPALLGILLRGKLASRDIAATLLDLARRGHLIIHQMSANDFRFARRASHDRLEDFEEVLLDQIFGPVGDKTSSEEISFTLAQELFSKRISQAFMLAYQKINELGYFYVNPLTLHRRYQTAGIFLFMLGIIGFSLNLFVFGHQGFFLLFWLGMMISALLVYHFSKGLPSRTVFGDRELAQWLAFGRTLESKEQVSFAQHNQEKYLAYLPYAIVLNSEVEWTRRFYELPFSQPAWYLAYHITRVDEFANKVFPMLGYLSHTLAISSQPGSR